MQWRKPHPWNGNYALPKHVKDEGPHRFNTNTTKYRRRRSIGPLGMRPPGWSPNLAIPEYIQNEPVGSGVFRTKYAPRRTVSALVPEYLGNYQSELGATMPLPVVAGGPNDPIAKFGEQVSTLIMQSVMKLPAPMRKDALKSLFEQLDPNLWSLVSRKADTLVKTRDMGPMEALEKAIASSTSAGLLKEILKMGQRKQAPDLKSMSGLATFGEIAEVVVLDGYMDSMQALGWCGPVCQAKKAGSAIKSATIKVGSTIKSGVTTAAKTTYSAGKAYVTAPIKAAKYVGGKVSSGAKAAYNFGKDVVKKVGGLACKVLSSDAGSAAAVAGAAAAGVPPQVGQIGASVGKQLCNGSPEEAAIQAAALEQRKFPTLLVVGGGAAVLGVLYLATRSK
jgi:hypothetical protein